MQCLHYTCTSMDLLEAGRNTEFNCKDIFGMLYFYIHENK